MDDNGQQQAECIDEDVALAMAKQYESEVLASVHETALGMTEAGVMSKRTMKVFDEMCLTPVEDMAPERIREIRLRENASQAVFARYLNVTKGLVSQWERGEKRPRGASLKLLTLVAKNVTVRGPGEIVRSPDENLGQRRVGSPETASFAWSASLLQWRSCAPSPGRRTLTNGYRRTASGRSPDACRWSGHRVARVLTPI